MGDLGGKKFIQRPAEDVLAEMKALRKKDPACEFILISDAVPPQWYKKLATLANKENFSLRTHSYMINNAALNEDFFKELSKAKVASFTFGTESTSDRVLKLMRKQATRKIVIDNLKLAAKYNLEVTVNLIPNYPTTTFAEAMSSYKIMNLFSDSLKSITVFKFYLPKGTGMSENPSAFGMEVSENAPYMKLEKNGFHSVEFKKLEGMSEEEEKEIYYKLKQLKRRIEKNRIFRKLDEYWKTRELEKIVFSMTLSLEGGVLRDSYIEKEIQLSEELQRSCQRIFDDQMFPKYRNLAEFEHNERNLSINEFELLKQSRLLTV